MPSIFFNGIYTPNDEEQYEAGEDERNFRHRQQNMFWRYYDGDHKTFLKMPVNAPYNDNIVFNLCSQAIDRSVAFLFPEMPVLKYTDESAQEVTDELWGGANIPSFLTDIGISGLVSGHVFLRLDNSEDMVSFVNIDPRVMTVFWDARQPQKPLWYRMTWVQGEDWDYETFFIEDYVPNTILSEKDLEEGATEDGWTIITYKWRPRKDERLVKLKGEAWNFPFAPIVDFKAQPRPFSYYGPSLLRHLHVNDVLNFLASNTNRILRFHAHPKTIITGAGKQDLESTAIDEVWAIPTSEAKVFNLEMQSDLGSSMEMIEKTRAAFFAQVHVVDTTSYKDKIGQITNFGVNVLFADMVDHTKVMQELYGRGLQEAVRRAVYIQTGTDFNVPQIVWPNPLPINETERVNAAKIEQSIGATSQQTLSEMLDRDFAQEQSRIRDERETAVINLAEQGIHDIADLPIQKVNSFGQGGTDAPNEPEEFGDSERLQRAIESI